MSKSILNNTFNAGHGKPDIERLGVFSESGYVSIGESFNTKAASFNESASKGKQFSVEFSKSKSGNQDGYFDQKFARIFESEALNEPFKQRAAQEKSSRAKNISNKPIYPAGPSQKLASCGNYLGSFEGRVEHFSVNKDNSKQTPDSNDSKNKSKPEKSSTLKNFYTSPGKKGIGSGYADLTIGKYPEYSSNQYDPVTSKNLISNSTNRPQVFRQAGLSQEFFGPNPYTDDSKTLLLKQQRQKQIEAAKQIADAKKKSKPVFIPSSPNKKMGGCKAGTFSKYPECFTDQSIKNKNGGNIIKSFENGKNTPRNLKNQSQNPKKPFLYNYKFKSTPISSVLVKNVRRGFLNSNRIQIKA